MADEVEIQWFRRSNGDEHNAVVGDSLYKRLVEDGEYIPIDGPEGDEMDLPTDEEPVEAEETATEPPFDGYDDLTVEEMIPKLEDLDADELSAVEAYEIANKNRATLLEAISAKRAALEETDEE